jgi:uncharacterized protein YecT (DUF1311 family)
MKNIFLTLLFIPSIAFSSPDFHSKKDFENLDYQLNQTYKTVLKELGNPLKIAQRTWLNFIKLDCDAQLSTFGTPPYTVQNYNECIFNHKKTRLQQLENINPI